VGANKNAASGKPLLEELPFNHASSKPRDLMGTLLALTLSLGFALRGAIEANEAIQRVAFVVDQDFTIYLSFSLVWAISICGKSPWAHLTDLIFPSKGETCPRRC
jgi:hypothetical protein